MFSDIYSRKDQWRTPKRGEKPFSILYFLLYMCMCNFFSIKRQERFTLELSATPKSEYSTIQQNSLLCYMEQKEKKKRTTLLDFTRKNNVMKQEI